MGVPRNNLGVRTEGGREASRKHHTSSAKRGHGHSSPPKVIDSLKNAVAVARPVVRCGTVVDPRDPSRYLELGGKAERQYSAQASVVVVWICVPHSLAVSLLLFNLEIILFYIILRNNALNLRITRLGCIYYGRFSSTSYRM